MRSEIVFLDPGHGGSDPGAVGHGLRESDMALDVCKRAKRILDPYLDCRLTREDDVFLSLSARPRMANEAGADLFVSYHFNSAANMRVPNSWEVYTTRGQNRSDRLADCIGREHAVRFPEQSARNDFSDGDLDKEANFAVIRGTLCPSCLMEGEFIHTSQGADLIRKDENREKMGEAVAFGVLNYLGITTAGTSDADLVEVISDFKEGLISGLNSMQKVIDELRKGAE